MKKKIIISLTFLIGVNLLSSCNNQQKKEKTIFRMPFDEIEGLDPSHTSYNSTLTVLNTVSEALYIADDKDAIIPGVALKLPEISEDGLTYKIEIREDSKWVDFEGKFQRNLTVDDFINSWKRTIDPRNASEAAYLFEAIEGYDAINEEGLSDEQIDKAIENVGFKKIGKTGIEIKLSYVAPYFIQVLASQILGPEPIELIEKHKELFGQSVETTWYNGPYYASFMDKPQQVITKKNSEYWDKGNVQIEEIHFLTTTDTQASLNAYNTEEFDYSKFPNDQAYQEYKTNSPEDIIDVSEAGSMGLYINLEKPNTKDLLNKNIRLALQSATDSKIIANDIVGTGTKSLSSYIPKDVTKAYGVEYTDINGELVTYDLIAAKKYLELGLKELNKEKNEVNISIMFAEKDSYKKIAEYLKNSWETSLGIKVTLDQRVQADYASRRRSGDFDIAFGGWTCDFGDPSNFLGIFTTPYINSMNTARYSDESFDKGYLEAVKIQDIEKRLNAFAKLEKQIIQTGAYIPMYQRGGAVLVNPKFIYPTNLVFKVSPKFMTYKD